ncbi:hypothetical protein EN829_046975 [Mesorhizobium sp. M00.F.Ca.ET.186.01.1.1]|nr:hypothetical protein EN829_046975 [Mesorhizobium sp. M00.F.Ca.ET.186.01.1.1]
MKKSLLALSSSALAFTFLLSPIQVLAAQPSNAPTIQYSIPDPGASFTLIAEKTETFDNTAVNAAVSSVLSFLFGKVTKLDKVKDSAGKIIGLSTIAAYINGKLSDHRFVYANVRLGISFNSYLGYYEYVESVVHYKDSSFSTPIDVYYAQTGTKVPDDVLAMYGLRNP